MHFKYKQNAIASIAIIEKCHTTDLAQIHKGVVFFCY